MKKTRENIILNKSDMTLEKAEKSTLNLLKPYYNYSFEKVLSNNHVQKNNVLQMRTKNLKDIFPHLLTLIVFNNSTKIIKPSTFLSKDSLLMKQLLFYRAFYKTSKKKGPLKFTLLYRYTIPYVLKCYKEALLPYNSNAVLEILKKGIFFSYRTNFEASQNEADTIPIKPEDIMKNKTCLAFLIDSEYKDLCKSGHHPFENKRDVYPVSISVSVFSYIDHSDSLYYTFIFNYDHYQYLKKNVKNNVEQDSLKYIDTKTKEDPSIVKEDVIYIENNNLITIIDNEKIVKENNFHKTELKTPILILNNNVFHQILFELSCPISVSIEETIKYYESPNIIKDIFLKKESGKIRSRLYYLPPDYVKRYKINQKCFYFPIHYFFSFKDYRYLMGDVIYFLTEQYVQISRISTFKNQETVSEFAFEHTITENFKDTYTTRSTLIKIILRDSCGLTGSSLKDFAATTNVILPEKDIVNKEDISETLMKNPETYSSYCLHDTIYLFQMLINFSISNKQIYENFNLKRYPSLLGCGYDSLKPTNGSNLVRLFETYIFSLNPSMIDSLDSISIKIKRSNGNEDDLYYLNGIEMGSAAYLKYLGGSAIEGCFVSGGRCCNERPFEQFFSYGFDIDLVSCYGNSITNLCYPIGIPRILKNDEGGFVMSLKDFLKKKKSELIPGLWYAVVSTKEKLSFSIDLFVSKSIPTSSFFKKGDVNTSFLGKRNIDTYHVKGDQMVLTNEIKNAVMVHEHLEILKNMCSNKEKKELYDKIWISMACYYPKSKKCDTPELFASKIGIHQFKKNKKPFYKKINNENASRTDDRCDFWYPVPMKDFVSPMIDERNKNLELYKKTKDPKYNAKQIYLKKNINMIYGCTASQFFKINNLCFANNVTGVAKCGVWIMSKALNLCQTITDGGIYEASSVNYPLLCKKKPSLTKLFSDTLKQNIEKPNHFKPLGCIRNNVEKKAPDFIKIFKRINTSQKKEFCISLLCKICDKIAKEHIDLFCKTYKLNHCFKFDVSHKPENTFLRASTLNRGHYYLYTLNNKDIFKIRSYQQKKGMDHISSAIFNIIKAKAFNKNTTLEYFTHTNSNLLKPKQLDQVRRKNLISPFTGIHDTYISKRELSFKLDSGKFSTYDHYKNLRSNFHNIHKFKYLLFCHETENNKFILNSEQFWKEYHEDLKTNCFEIFLKSRSNNILCDNIKSSIKKANKIDKYFLPKIELDTSDESEIYDFFEDEEFES